MFIICLMVDFRVKFVIPHSFIIHNIKSDEDSRIPRTPIKIFMNLILLYTVLLSGARGVYTLQL